MNYRSRPLLDLAHRVNECKLCGRYSPEGCEPAHSNQQTHGKGMSVKAHDLFHAAICHSCHLEIDSGLGDRAAKQEAWRQAFDQTLLHYFANGWLKVSK